MNIHFIAIGGSAMHNLALALSEKGEIVTGSDDIIFEPSQSRLKKAGLLPEKFGWFPEKITKETDAVILGMHAKKDNPELIKAQNLGIPIFSYPEFLYEHAKDKTRVVIGGSHGKTSITAMILHVLKAREKEVDFMVGAQLEGFRNMVHLTEENDFIVLEGDEYLSSPTDRRPKFHLYKANIGLISGIAWDHINVFPTFENYVEQFKIFIETITPDGVLVYNEEDEILKEIVENSPQTIRKFPYSTPKYNIKQGRCFLETDQGEIQLEIFGKHNLNNLAGAKVICELMGVEASAFYQSISSFKGASKRLEKLAESSETVVFKDFAHSPSKVKATTQAVKDQYPEKNLIACFELHTYSSLNSDFLKEYHSTLQAADKALVFYSPENLEIKGLDPIEIKQIEEAFDHPDLTVFTKPKKFESFLRNKELKNSVLLLMSSGNYGGLNIEEIIHKI